MILPAGQAFAPFLAALPANRLEALKGTQKGRYSIRVNDQYRLTFRFEAATPSMCASRTAPSWMNLQNACDLWHAQRAMKRSA